MSDIPSQIQKIQIEGARYGSAVSESIIQYMGAAINKVMDFITSPVSHNVIGAASTTTAKTGYGTFGDTLSVSCASGEYKLVVAVPGTGFTTFGVFGKYTAGISAPGGGDFLNNSSNSIISATSAIQVWITPGQTVQFDSQSGGSADYTITTFSTVPINDYPTS